MNKSMGRIIWEILEVVVYLAGWLALENQAHYREWVGCFSFTKRNAVEGAIIPNGPRLFWKVTQRILPGVLIVRPYQPWSHR